MKNKTKLKLECSKKEAIDLNVLASMLCLFTLWQNNMTFLINKIISKTINSLQMLVVNFQAFMDTEKKQKQNKQTNKLVLKTTVLLRRKRRNSLITLTLRAIVKCHVFLIELNVYGRFTCMYVFVHMCAFLWRTFIWSLVTESIHSCELPCEH